MSNSYIDCFKLAHQVFTLILKDPIMFGVIHRVVNHVDDIDEESLRKFAIANLVETVSLAYVRAKNDERVEVRSLWDGTHVITQLVDGLARLEVDLPGIDFIKSGKSEFTELFDAHLKGNGIQVGVNRGDDQELKVYLKPEFDGLGGK